MSSVEWNLERDGFRILPRAVDVTIIDRLLDVFETAFDDDSQSVRARSSKGYVYAARNLLDSIPEVTLVWQKDPMLGLPHVIANDDLLRQMLTLRIHLDDVTDENGPLRVIPRSHIASECEGLGVDHAVTIHANAGDVLAMRPLMSHSSGASIAGTMRHRRILHLEFAATERLQDGYQWHDYIRPTIFNPSAPSIVVSEPTFPD